MVSRDQVKLSFVQQLFSISSIPLKPYLVHISISISRSNGKLMICYVLLLCNCANVRRRSHENCISCINNVLTESDSRRSPVLFEFYHRYLPLRRLYY